MTPPASKTLNMVLVWCSIRRGLCWWIGAGLIRWDIHVLSCMVSLGIALLVGMDDRGIDWRLLRCWLEVDMARLLVILGLITRCEHVAS